MSVEMSWVRHMVKMLEKRAMTFECAYMLMNMLEEKYDQGQEKQYGMEHVVQG